MARELDEKHMREITVLREDELLTLKVSARVDDAVRAPLLTLAAFCVTACDRPIVRGGVHAFSHTFEGGRAAGGPTRRVQARSSRGARGGRASSAVTPYPSALLRPRLRCPELSAGM